MWPQDSREEAGPLRASGSLGGPQVTSRSGATTSAPPSRWSPLPRALPSTQRARRSRTQGTECPALPPQEDRELHVEFLTQERTTEVPLDGFWGQWLAGGLAGLQFSEISMVRKGPGLEVGLGNSGVVLLLHLAVLQSVGRTWRVEWPRVVAVSARSCRWVRTASVGARTPSDQGQGHS